MIRFEFFQALTFALSFSLALYLSVSFIYARFREIAGPASP